MFYWLGRGSSDITAFKYIQKECLLKGIPVLSDYKKILGQSFGVLHAGRLNNDDIKACIYWASALKD